MLLLLFLLFLPTFRPRPFFHFRDLLLLLLLFLLLLPRSSTHQ